MDYRLKSFTEGSQDRRLEAGTRRQELKYRPCRTPFTGLLSLFSYAAQAHTCRGTALPEVGPDMSVTNKTNNPASQTFPRVNLMDATS